MNTEAKVKEWLKSKNVFYGMDEMLSPDDTELARLVTDCINDLTPGVQDEWISVDDELPSKFEIVMIYPQPEYMGTIYEGEYDGEKWLAQFEDSHQTYNQEVKVTHWKVFTEPK